MKKLYKNFEPVFVEDFSNEQDVFDQFCVSEEDRKKVAKILYAEYTYEDYSGSAFVLFVGTDNKLYEVHGGHCSCYGLEDQWDAEETSKEYFQELLDRGSHVDDVIVNLFSLKVKS